MHKSSLQLAKIFCESHSRIRQQLLHYTHDHKQKWTRGRERENSYNRKREQELVEKKVPKNVNQSRDWLNPVC